MRRSDQPGRERRAACRWGRVACRVIAGAAMLAGVGVLHGCTYERVVRSNRPLAGLPGAEGAVNVGERAGASAGLGYVPQKFILHEDGRVELLTRTVSDLMLHIRGTLQADNAEMFTEQLLSERTSAEFRARGEDPSRAFAMLKAREPDFHALHARMPVGEGTPGVLMHKLGERTYRAELSGLAARDLAWRGIDVVWEGAEWRLRWFR